MNERESTTKPPESNQDLAERYGRKTIVLMIEGAPLESIEFWARLAFSYARLVISERTRLVLVQQMADEMIAWEGTVQ